MDMSEITRESLAVELTTRLLNKESADDLEFGGITESLLALLVDEFEDNNMLAKSIIRLLVQKNVARMHPLWDDTLNKFFGPHLARMNTSTYVETTRAIVLENFNIDLPTITLPRQIEKMKTNKKKATKVKKAKTVKKPEKVIEGVEGKSGSKTFKSIKQQKKETIQ
jgi:hypothetical protein